MWGVLEMRKRKGYEECEKQQKWKMERARRM